jgi:hypothetical protein
MNRTFLAIAGVLAVSFSLVACTGSETQTSAKSAEPAAPHTGPLLTLDPATTGTITGTVNLIGDPPAPRTVNMSIDPFCKQPASGPVVFPDVVTGEHGRLASVVIYVKSGLGNYHFESPRTPMVLDQENCMYEPHVLALMPGQPLDVKNSDSTNHNVHPMSHSNPPWNKAEPAHAAPIVESFARPEMAIPVMCNVHPWMRAYIFVFGDPYFAVTTKSGAFELKNVPPGTYTVEAWQETLGTVDETVTLGPKESKSIAFDFQAKPAATP